MKNCGFIYTLFVCLGVLSSCSSIPEERKVSVSNVEITGFVKNYMKVVDGTYTFTQNGDDAFITVKLELVHKLEKEITTTGFYGFRINALSEDGGIFDTGYYGFSAENSELEKVEELLKGNVGEQKNISFKWDYFGVDKEIGEKIFTKAASFELIDKTFKEKVEKEVTVTNSNVSSSNRSTKKSGNDWDSILDDYEKYYDQYIKLMKKAKNGDVSAMTEYVTMLEKAQSIGERLSNAQGDLTAAQSARFLKIQQKLVNAAAEF